MSNIFVRAGLQGEHYKYADPVVSCLLAMVINCMIGHAYIPDAAMDTIIVPIVKDKKGLLTNKDNYRPVAITTVFSKILESAILNRYRQNLESLPNQFGFKHGCGTDMSIFVLKQVIEFYHSLSSPVYVAYLDASKAFDKLNHWSLFRKLLDRGLPKTIVRLFLFWYMQQRFCVRWGKVYSIWFHTSNGVRQGGIISPILFNVYMDDLSADLNAAKVGCQVNGVFINNLMYADDSCLLAPSISALQRLLNICMRYAKENNIVYNKTKTNCMCYKPKKLRNLHVPAVYLSGSRLKFVGKVKYLGVIIDQELSDNDDLLRHRKFLYGKGNTLIRHFRMCSEAVKDRLFFAYCNNVYGGHLWTKYHDRTLKSVCTAFNDIYRIMHNMRRDTSMSHVYVTRNIDSFKVLIRKAAYVFRERILKSNNNLVISICTSWHFYNHSSFTQLWNKTLFV